jgi:hypothetical protein
MGKGGGLEATVVASQRNIIRVDKMHAGARFARGGKAIPVHGPVDFVGEVCATGRSICFDCKETEEPTCFYLKWLPEHQRQYLMRHGEARAIAGLVIEAKAARRFVWVPWRCLTPSGLVSIRWDYAEVVDLGPTTHAIRFEAIPEVAVEIALSAFPEFAEFRPAREAIRSFSKAFKR